MDRKQAIRTVVENLSETVPVVSANGMISRDLCSVKDSPNNFYMLGSMGLASSIGLGIALSNKQKKVMILDGDGNILMNLGSLATIGNAGPRNLIHVVFDNESYDSTGGQPTASKTIRIDRAAKISGYKKTSIVFGSEKLAAAIRGSLKSDGPSLILVKINRSRSVSPRVPYEPESIRRRFQEFVCSA